MSFTDQPFVAMPINTQAYMLGVDAAGLPALSCADPRLNKGELSLRAVNLRGRGPCPDASGDYSSAMTRYWDVSVVPVRYVQFPFMNWFADQADGVEKGPGADTTVAISIEYPKDTFTQITWNSAQSTASVGDGVTLWSDVVDLGFTIPAYTRYWVRIYWTNASKMIACGWSLSADTARGDAFVFNGSNQTMSGTVTDNASGVYSMRLPMLSYSTRVVRGLFGDSIVAGVNTTFFDTTGQQGILAAAAKLGPTINFGCPGDSMAWFNSSSALRIALATACGMHQGVNAYGVNDIDRGTSSATLLTARDTFRSKFSVPIFDTTITTQTNSTDNWRTAANQTPVDSTKNTQRTIHNTAVRAGLANSPGVIDLAAMLETSSAREYGPVLNGGVGIPRFYDVDSVHPNTFAQLHVAASVEAMFMAQAAQ